MRLKCALSCSASAYAALRCTYCMISSRFICLHRPLLWLRVRSTQAFLAQPDLTAGCVMAGLGFGVASLTTAPVMPSDYEHGWYLRPAMHSTAIVSLCYTGKRRYDSKQAGYGGQTKPVFHKKVC